MTQEESTDEVLFWEWLIHWWKANQDEPVPERMYVALKLAEERGSLLNNISNPGALVH